MSEKVKCRYGKKIEGTRSSAKRVCRRKEIGLRIYNIKSVCKDCSHREIKREA